MKWLKRILTIVCVAVLVMSLSACGNRNKVSTEEFEWPTTGMATILPEPTTLRGEIVKNDTIEFYAKISQTTEDDYKEYVEACKDKGFTVDMEESDSRFDAYNEDGYIIQLTYHPDEEYYKIDLYPPRFEAGETFSWPTTGLATLLPEPASNIGTVSNDRSDYLTVCVGETSVDDFNNYIDACIEAGFDVDYIRHEKYYTAKNTTGVELTLDYLGYNTFIIKASAEEEEESTGDGEYSEFSWPDSEIAKLLPVPKSNIGKIEWAEDYGFVIYVAETPKEDYNAYVNEVQEAGFTIDSHKSDDAFWADNEDGYHVYLTFEDNDVMFVRMDEPDKEESAENTEEAQETEDTEAAASDSSSSVAGVSDEFKAAMDSYEEFFDEYVEFMKKYNDAGDTTDMLSDLNDYMAKYSETMDKFNALGDDDMTPEEVKYYAEVTERIYKKLAELN